MKNEFKIWSTNKFIIITVPKVASRFIERSLKQDSLLNSNIVYIDNDLKLKKTEISNLSNEILMDINQINTKKNKKDLLFLYRNPYNKLLSGIAQDFNQNIKEDKFLFNIVVDHYIKDNNIDIDENELVNYSSQLIHPDHNPYGNFHNRQAELKSKSTDINVVFEELYEYLINKFIQHSYVERNFETIHTHDYLYILYTFLNSNDIDLNKVKILDIDYDTNLLMKFFKMYEIETEGVHKASNNLTKKILSNLITKKSNIKKILLNKIKNEEFFYELLKKSNLNFR